MRIWCHFGSNVDCLMGGVFFSSRRRHTRLVSDWSSDVCSSDLWREAIFWVLMPIALLIWNMLMLWPKVHPEITIPYSIFLTQVRSGNVARIQITGVNITGSLVKPLRWPESDSQSSSPSAPKSNSPPSTPTVSSNQFLTSYPAAIGDPHLLPLLEEHKVFVEVVNPATPLSIELLSNWVPTLLLIGFFWWMGMKASQNQTGLFGIGRTKARRYNEDQPKVTFNDVAGADEAKSDLQEEVDFLRNPAKYHNVGARIPRGVLLVGPPGTGKTLLARAVAGEAGVPFFSLSASEFVEMFVGVGASRVRDLFTQAKATSPAI